jgi:transglutaminase-like putative cysteine protease
LEVQLRTPVLISAALFAPLLLSAAEPSCLGPMARAIETQAVLPYGICYGEARLWILDIQSRTIARTDPDTGCPICSVPAPGEHPTDLAHDGRYLWVLSDDRVFVVDPDSGDVVATNPLGIDGAQGIALDETRVWVSDGRRGRIVTYARAGLRIDPAVRGEVRVPGIGPRGLCYHDGSLWLIDSMDRTLYRLDPPSGWVTLAVFAEREFPRGIAFVRGEPVVSYQRDRVVEPLEYELGDGYCRSSEHHVKVTYTHTIANKSPKPIRDVRINLALPLETAHQHILSMRLEPEPQARSADRYGQPLARYRFERLAPGEEIRVCWTVEADLWAVRYALRPAAASEADADGDLAPYLESSKYVPLDSETVRRHAHECLDGIEDRTAKIRAARDHVLGCVSYEFAGGWDDAATVLERGTGSCSEYSFALAAILRSDGIPTRFVGATATRGDVKQYTDKVYHRWVEVYVPGTGWLPVDANRDDRKSGPPFPNRSFFATDWPMLVISRGGGGDEQGIGWDYRSSQRWDWGENGETERRVRTSRAAVWEILE